MMSNLRALVFAALAALALATPALAGGQPIVICDQTSTACVGPIASSPGVPSQLPAVITQNVIIPPGLQSSTNLAASASFTGVGFTTLGVGSIQVNTFADQPLLIKVQQSTDNVNWDTSDNYVYAASSTGQDSSRTITATSAFARVVVQNTGGSTTTVLRITTAFCPMCQSGPRAPSAGGFNQVVPTPSGFATDGITPIASGSAAASLVLKGSPGNFYGGSAANITATAGFCLIINATVAPGSGSGVTPLEFAALPANGTCVLNPAASGPPDVFSTGIVFLVSSNASPYTFTSGVITAAISGRAQ